MMRCSRRHRAIVHGRASVKAMLFELSICIMGLLALEPLVMRDVYYCLIV